MANLLSIEKKEEKSSYGQKVLSNAQVLVNTLESLGVENIFGYPGASVLSIYNELARTKKIKHYLVRHEQAAVHAAEGFARVSGKCGVVLVTSGPGFTNTVTGIANAYADGTPLIVLAGDVASNVDSSKLFQKIDIEAVVATCTKKVYSLKADDDIESLIINAFNDATSNIKGPVVISLPRNILEAQYKKKEALPIHNECCNQNIFQKVNEFNSLLAKAKAPLLLVGGGAIDSCSELLDFLDNYMMPAVSTLMGIGVLPTDNELYLGMIGQNGSNLANTILKESDLILALGVSFSDRSTCKDRNFAAEAKLVSVNVAQPDLDFDLEITADVSEFLKALLVLPREYRVNEDWFNVCKRIKQKVSLKSSLSKNATEILNVISELTKDKNPIVVTDVGQHQMIAAQNFRYNLPRHFITSGGLGTMGFGLPAAIGAHIAAGNTLILNITGDGSFQMNLQELATCREYGIPLKIIIINNSSLGMVKELQEKIYNNKYQVDMINPDFVKIAEAYDLFGVRVEKKDDLIPALKEAIMFPGTAIVDIMETCL